MQTQVIRSLQRSLENKDYYETVGSIERLCKSLGYEFVKSDGPTSVKPGILISQSLSENIEPLLIDTKRRCLHYRDPSTKKPEGIIFNLTKRVYPDSILLVKSAFHGYGRRWTRRALWRTRYIIPNCYTENLDVPTEVHNVEPMTPEQFIKKIEKSK